MLDRAFDVLQREHPDLIQSSENKKRLKLKPLQLSRQARNTNITNFEEVCKSLKRPLDHVMLFLLTELGCKGNLNQENNLILRDRYQEKIIEKGLSQYIKEYIQCRSCKAFNTMFSKSDRTLEIVCEECHASRCVQAIKQEGALTKVRKVRK
ncbi:MAG: putative eukaryotic translation initiation factor 2 subunit beta [Streblomastix strix]|uniref:Putative eukaryotic translation initiation factor 2 subunit beta n=1 Tax=Streblomastix strix TaxID=222440 RepID=A0A5J4WRH5_9EUKA|nr:MAG: putative eukaryotic translation initiation factor 2 subunit beta [Streblomastix strix]